MSGCKYCRNEEIIEENENDRIYIQIWHKHLYIRGNLFTVPFGRDILINYCPMCRKKVRRLKCI